jgi:hypothetical protein
MKVAQYEVLALKRGDSSRQGRSIPALAREPPASQAPTIRSSLWDGPAFFLGPGAPYRATFIASLPGRTRPTRCIAPQ